MIKPYPSCRHNHYALDLFAAIKKEQGYTPRMWRKWTNWTRLSSPRERSTSRLPARERDKLREEIHCVCLFWSGQPDAAVRHLRDILAFEPRDFLANQWLGHIAALTGRYDEAREAAARAFDISGSPKALAGLGFVEARAGGIEAAESIVDALRQRARTEYVAYSRLAAIHVALGQLPEAGQALQRARRDGDWDLGFARGDARWERVRDLFGVR